MLLFFLNDSETLFTASVKFSLHFFDYRSVPQRAEQRQTISVWHLTQSWSSILCMSLSPQAASVQTEFSLLTFRYMHVIEEWTRGLFHTLTVFLKCISNCTVLLLAADFHASCSCSCSSCSSVWLAGELYWLVACAATQQSTVTLSE